MEGSAICLWKCTNERRTVVLQCQFAIWGTRLVFLRNGCPLVPKPGRVHKALAARRDVKKASMFFWLDLLTSARRHLWYIWRVVLDFGYSLCLVSSPLHLFQETTSDLGGQHQGTRLFLRHVLLCECLREALATFTYRFERGGDPINFTCCSIVFLIGRIL